MKPDVIIGVLPRFFSRNLGYCARLGNELKNIHVRFPAVPIYGNGVAFIEDTVPVEIFDSEEKIVSKIRENNFSSIMILVPDTAPKGRTAYFFKQLIEGLTKTKNGECHVSQVEYSLL